MLRMVTYAQGDNWSRAIWKHNFERFLRNFVQPFLRYILDTSRLQSRFLPNLNTSFQHRGFLGHTSAEKLGLNRTNRPWRWSIEWFSGAPKEGENCCGWKKMWKLRCNLERWRRHENQIWKWFMGNNTSNRMSSLLQRADAPNGTSWRE